MNQSTNQILKYDVARQALAEANNLDDVKILSDKADALQHYAKQIHDVDMEMWIAEIKVRAKRKIGKLTKEIQQAKTGGSGGGRSPDAGVSKAQQLKQAGISTQEASRCEKLSEIDEDEFEDVFVEAKKDKKPVTIASIEKKVKDKQKKTTVDDKKAEYTEATISSIENNQPIIHLTDCIKYMSDMNNDSVDLLITDPPYSTDIEDIKGFAESWLLLAISKVKKNGRAFICIGAYPKELQAYLNILLSEQDKFIVDNPLIWTYRNTLGQTPKMKYNLNYQVILHLYSEESPELDTSITNEMFSVQDINAPDGRQGDRYHTWQKPDELAMRLVSHSTKKDDIVFDPFSCTGTFLIAASKLNRKSFGCEVDENNLIISEERGCVRA